jgi:hypothetical protein
LTLENDFLIFARVLLFGAGEIIIVYAVLASSESSVSSTGMNLILTTLP